MPENRFQQWLDEHAHDRSPEILEKVRQRGLEPPYNRLIKKNGFATDEALGLRD